MKMTNNKGKILVLLCIFISIVLIFTTMVTSLDHDQTKDSFVNASASESLTGSYGSKGDGRSSGDALKKSLTEFSTGSTEITVLGSPDGKSVYIPLPPDANVTHASMAVQGRTPEVLNKLNIGGRLSSISGGDFNSDGKLDIVVTEKDNHTMRILLNKGNNQLLYKHEYLTGDLPTSTIIDDFNNDSHVDIAVANQGANTFTVYQNNGTGDGGFKNKKDYKIGDIPREVTSANFNGDGWPDLATVTSNDNKVWVNLNQKQNAMSFASASNFSTDHSPVGLASGDLNNDGLDDIAVIHVGANLTINNLRYYSSVSVFINKGNAEFTSRDDYPVGKKPAGIVIDDFNNDGWLDLATSNRGGYNVSVLLNRGDGKFDKSINYSIIGVPHTGINLETGDIDGDGDSDIVSFCSKFNTIEVLINRGDGTFKEFLEYPASLRPSAIFLGDFDNDGDLDVSACSLSSGDVGIIYNNGDGTFATFEFFYIGTYPRGIVSGDLNADGSPDLISANYLGGSLTICYNDGKGKFESRFDKEIAVEPFAVIVGDFNSDGSLDLASADEALYKIVLAFNDGDGKFTQKKVEYDIGGYPYSMLFHDLNGDGKGDLITGNNAQLSISILFNQGNGTFAPNVDYSFEYNYPFGLAAGDMDGDGDEDIICSNYGIHAKAEGTNISIIWNDGNGTFTSHQDYEVDQMPISVIIRDLDLDGDRDIVVSNMGSNSTTVLLNHGNRTFGSRQDYPVGQAPICVDISDLDNNGYPDLVTANQQSDSISILYNKGDGSFNQHKEYLMGAQPVYVAITDLNSDGMLDIASCNLLSNSISVRMDIHYPKDITINLGENGSPEYILKGQLSKTTMIADFSDQLNSYLTTHQSEVVSTPNGPVVFIPVNISATHMGIIELKELDIKYEIGPDYDNDQIPDVWEIEHGLDNTNPVDAQADTDNDGLTNLQEFLNNTLPNHLDSDKDGLNDGEEVKNYHTNPLNEDTDDDGYTDFKEIDAGTDPLDSDDHPDKSSDEVCFTPGFGTELILIAIILVLIILSLSTQRRFRK